MKPQAPKVNGNDVEDTEWNSPVQEPLRFVESSGQTPDEKDGFQLSKGVAQYAAVGDYYQDTGTPNNYVVDAISPRQGIPNLRIGQKIRFVATTTNTSAAFINVQATGSISIRDHEGAALFGGEVQTGAKTTVEYDGTYWRLTNGAGGLTALLHPVDGLTVSNSGTLPNTNLNFAVGKCGDSNKNFLIVNTLGGFTKNMTVNWVAGTGNGGKASGVSITPATWYYVFAVSTPAGVVDFGIDTNINAVNLLADTSGSGYIKWRRIWTMYAMPTTSFIRPFIQYGNTHLYYGRRLATADYFAPGFAGSTLYPVPLIVPKNIHVYALIEYWFESGTGAGSYDVNMFNSQQLNIASGTQNPCGMGGAVFTKDQRGRIHIRPDSAGAIQYRLNIVPPLVGSALYINTLGFEDFRTI